MLLVEYNALLNLELAQYLVNKLLNEHEEAHFAFNRDRVVVKELGNPWLPTWQGLGVLLCEQLQRLVSPDYRQHILR